MSRKQLSGIRDTRIVTQGEYPVAVRKGTLAGELTITIPPHQPTLIYLDDLNRWMIPAAEQQRVYDLLTADATLFRLSPDVS